MYQSMPPAAWFVSEAGAWAALLNKKAAVKSLVT
jgi:hypothetical protein